MRQFQLNFWNSFKRLFCYHTGTRQLLEDRVKVWKKYDRLTDIPIEDMKSIIQEEHIKTIILDMDGTLKHYKYGLLEKNKKWVEEIKDLVKIFIISNANEELTAKVANELNVQYVCKAKKPSRYGFDKICKLSGAEKHEVIVIGDSIRADINGAYKAGIQKTILLKDLNIIGIETGKNEYEKFYYYALNFILYSFTGWIIEMIYHLTKGIVENRGFLFGPFCIIYGISTCIMLKLDEKLKSKKNIIKAIKLWIYVFIICSVIEYITSFFTEWFFGIRLWDYSGLSFNIKGRVRLITSIAWANCSILVIYVIKPFVKKLFEKIKNKKVFYLIIHIILWMMFFDWISAIIRYV